MFTRLMSVLVVLVVLPALYGGLPDPSIGKRGDVNNDGLVDVSDMVSIGVFVYQGGGGVPCLNQADVDDDGDVDGSDVTYLALWFYSAGPPPAAPGPLNDAPCKPSWAKLPRERPVVLDGLPDLRVG